MPRYDLYRSITLVNLGGGARDVGQYTRGV